MSETGEGGASEENLRVNELVPKGAPLFAEEVRAWLVEVNSDTDQGRELHTDPIGFIRREIPEMGISADTDVRAMVLRANAELPANPRHRKEVWLVSPGSTIAVGVQFKYEPEPSS